MCRTERHDRRLTAYSSPGVGTTIHVHLPVNALPAHDVAALAVASLTTHSV
jgi:signal transduction histidine kinase